MDIEKEFQEFAKNERKRVAKNAIFAISVLLVIAGAIGGVVFFCLGQSNYWNNSAEAEEAWKNSGWGINQGGKKPIIYIYPTEEIELSVTLGNPQNITCSYPKYEDGWTVKAEPDGDLTDLKTERQLYSLYYECDNKIQFDTYNDGFVVKGSEVAEFLEEKLAILGLNEREAEEFIIYWLPKMEENEYNYIRFATYEEIEENMPLEFSVEPDSVIRVMMVFEGLDEYIEVPEQQLETPSREGFVVVEWGATPLE